MLTVRRPFVVLLALAAGLASVGATPIAAQRPEAPTAAAVRVLRVAPPADSGSWEWQVETSSAVRLLGTAKGRTGASRAPVLVTVQVGADLEMGRREIGVVSFTQAGRLVRTPLVIDVAARRALELRSFVTLALAEPGSTTELDFSLHNAGNAVDSVRLSTSASGAWDLTLSLPPMVEIAPGATVPVKVRVRSPAQLTAGGTVIRLQAQGHATAVEAQVTLEVGDTRGTARRGALAVDGSLSFLGGDAGIARSIASLGMHGEIVPGLRIDGSVMTPVGLEQPSIARGASAVGLPLMGTQLRLSTSRAALDLGRVALSLPELAGRMIGGNGAALRADLGGTFTAAAVTDELGGLTQGALTWSGTSGPFAVEAAAVRLRNGTLGTGAPRGLDALAVGARLRPAANTTIGIELADRRAAGVSALGAATSFAWEGTAGRVNLRAQHAPGGTDAMAIAQDAFSGESILRLGTHWNVATHGWMTRNEQPGDRGRLTSMGAGIAPTRSFGRTGELGAVLLVNGFGSASAGVRQEALDTDVGLRAAITVGAARIDVEASERQQVRAMRTASLDLADRTGRAAVRSGVTFASRFGSFGARGSFAAATTTQASELAMEVRASDLRPLPSARWLVVEGSLQRTYLGLAGMDNARIALRADLPGGTAVQFGLERESWRGASLLPSRNAVALRIIRRAQFAGADRWRVRTGIVFEDRDDDGVRDADEPALAGVRVHAGGTQVVSDRDGKFRVASTVTSVDLDVRTLRADQRPGTRNRQDPFTLPVRTVGQLDVALRRLEAGRGTAAAVVTAKDQRGLEWRASIGRDGVARFDALPVGVYTVTAASTEPGNVLRVEEREVTVSRGATAPGIAVARVELLERGRPVRLQGTGGLGVNGLIQQNQQQNQQLDQPKDQPKDQRQQLRQNQQGTQQQGTQQQGTQQQGTQGGQQQQERQ